MNQIAKDLIKNYLAGKPLVSADLESQRQYNILTLGQQAIQGWIDECQGVLDAVGKEPDNGTTSVFATQYNWPGTKEPDSDDGIIYEGTKARIELYMNPYKEVLFYIDQELTLLTPLKPK